MVYLLGNHFGINFGGLVLQHGFVQQPMIGLVNFNQLRLRTGDQI
jgi:hypothetical protein